MTIAAALGFENCWRLKILIELGFAGAIDAVSGIIRWLR
jgi:hypothetical protein